MKEPLARIHVSPTQQRAAELFAFFADAIQFLGRTAWPVVDLIVRFWIAMPAIVSGLLMANDWNTALMLASRRRDLVEERLKQVIVMPIDQCHLHRRMAQRPGASYAAKPCTNDHNAGQAFEAEGGLAIELGKRRFSTLNIIPSSDSAPGPDTSNSAMVSVQNMEKSSAAIISL